MGLFANKMPPALPQAPAAYDLGFMNRLLGTLRVYFTDISAVQQVNISKLNFDIGTLPTEADIALLRSGDVYRDTTADNALKVNL